MSHVLAVLLVGILALVYCTSCSTGPIANGVKKLKARFAGGGCCSGSSGDETKSGMSVAEGTRVVSKLNSIFDKEDTVRSGSAYTSGSGEDAYDPINMGALKQTEIDAHKRGVADMTPFNSYGPAGPNKTIRDDDDWARSTGVPYVGGRPKGIKQLASGPQPGARQVPSTSDKDIYQAHLMSANEPTWG